MELKYVLLFLAAVYPETIGLRCLSCQGVFEPRYCIQTTQCSPGEQCYTEQVIDNNLYVFYNVGCKSSQLCKVADQEGFGKRTGQLHVCEKCCTTDKCNNESCTHPNGGPSHICLKCPDVASPLDCKTSGVCSTDEMCFTQEFVNAKLERRYSLGCEKTKRCELLDQFVPHQRSTQLCNQCCLNPNCNKYLCTVPKWFVGTNLCFEWRADGSGLDQCGDGEGSNKYCASVNEWTTYYKDRSDDSGGGCQMRWSIESVGYGSWFNKVEICYHWISVGYGRDPCGVGETCASVGTPTNYYKDDTDNMSKACQMQWMLSVPVDAPKWIQNAQLCYQWYTDDDKGQCGGEANGSYCAIANTFTSFYSDHTNENAGGCYMRWKIIVDT